MQFDTLVDDRDRLPRLLLAAALALAAADSFRRGRRLRGVLAGIGAVGVGASAMNSERTVDVVTTKVGLRKTPIEAGGIHCAACTKPIVAGQRRGPNAENRIVHDGCL